MKLLCYRVPYFFWHYVICFYSWINEVFFSHEFLEETEFDNPPFFPWFYFWALRRWQSAAQNLYCYRASSKIGKELIDGRGDW